LSSLVDRMSLGLPHDLVAEQYGQAHQYMGTVDDSFARVDDGAHVSFVSTRAWFFALTVLLPGVETVCHRQSNCGPRNVYNGAVPTQPRE
jgi:hypothetical protein